MASKAEHPDQGSKKIASQLKAEMPNAALTASSVSTDVRENESVSASVPSAEAPREGSSQTKHSHQPLTSTSLSPFGIIETPGKGKGAIATRDIAAGELLLAEKPILCIGQGVPGVLAKAGVQRLSSEKQAEFYSLHASGARNIRREPDIISTNAFTINTFGDLGVFTVASRINHTCRPNINHCWEEDDNELRFHALEAISKGEELGFSYVEQLLPRKGRQALLKNMFGFDCTCEVCNLEGSALSKSDERRRQLADMEKGLSAELKTRPLDTLSKVEKALAISKEERLESRMLMFATAAYEISYCVLKDMDRAKAWASKTYALARNIFGEKNSETIKYRNFMSNPGNPTAISEWEKMSVLQEVLSTMTSFSLS